ncbi:hypothetical protein LCGC14_2643170, partial [marine sediment metagenome]
MKIWELSSVVERCAYFTQHMVAKNGAKMLAKLAPRFDSRSSLHFKSTIQQRLTQ